MTVELAVTIPIIMAVLGIVINTMVYLDMTARFDRLAADAVRIEATSPGYGSYGTGARVGKVRSLLQEQFVKESRFVRIDVSAQAGAGGGGGGGGGAGGGAGEGGGQGAGSASGLTFSFVPQLETYVCTMRYSPWGFRGSFFGINFLEMSHTRSFTIDPYRPAVVT
ncbi:MAG: hypothetical protein LBB42_04675 [Coriobacteriales bacterium]|jgi:hypothetical protein|nr:hypothetical protein [Coriobacteriales bacterium]